MEKTSIILLFIIVLSAVPFAQENLSNEPGKWDYSYSKEGKGGYRSELNYSMTTSELNRVRQKIIDAVETLHQNPVLANPKGFTPTVEAAVYADVFSINYNVSKLKNTRVQTEIVVRFCPLYRNKSGNISKSCIEVSHCDIMFNNPRSSTKNFSNWAENSSDKELNELAKKLNEIFIKPGVIKNISAGITAYDDGKIVIANTKRPYWIPIMVGEYLDLQIKFWQRNSKIEGNTFVLDAIKKEMSSFTPDELKMPAYAGGNLTKITITENDAPYMRFNPDYFDNSVQRTDVQLITLNTLTQSYSEECKSENLDYKRHCEFLKTLDLEKLKQLLDAN